MYNDENLVYIFTKLEAIEKIEIYTKNIADDEEFYRINHQMNFNAVVSLLIAIGEENKKIDETIKNENPFSWNNISKMRDKKSHNYRGINPYMVWDIIQSSIPEYKKKLIKILPKVEYFNEALKDALDSKFYMHLNYLKNIS